MRQADETEVFNLGPVQLKFIVPTDSTGGAWEVLEYTAPARFAGPAPHWHRHMTEWFYVLEGELELTVESESRKLGPGGFGLVAPGHMHRFANPGDEPVRFLVMLSPGGFQEYFVHLRDLISQSPQWPPADMNPVIALAERYDTFSGRSPASERATTDG